jgi:hypothetical protein
LTNIIEKTTCFFMNFYNKSNRSRYEIVTIKLIMRSVFIIYFFDVINIDTFLYEFDQS